MNPDLNTRVVSFHYTLTDETGETLDSSIEDEPMMFLEGVGQIIPGLETKLLAMQIGDKATITVEAPEAYGDRKEELVFEVSRAELPKEPIKIGDRFHSSQDQNAPPLTVTDVTDTHVTLDANHPLAGKDLTFAVEIVEIRKATAEELEHGHAHGAHGHHH